jgi:hypothetical protein
VAFLPLEKRITGWVEVGAAISKLGPSGTQLLYAVWASGEVTARAEARRRLIHQTLVGAYVAVSVPLVERMLRPV